MKFLLVSLLPEEGLKKFRAIVKIKQSHRSSLYKHKYQCDFKPHNGLADAALVEQILKNSDISNANNYIHCYICHYVRPSIPIKHFLPFLLSLYISVKATKMFQLCELQDAGFTYFTI